MMECATAVAILQMYQMYSGGHLVQLPALSRDNSTRLLRAFFSPRTDSWLFWASCCSALLSPKRNQKIAEAKIISCLQVLLFCWFCFKPAPLPIFLGFCDLMDARSAFQCYFNSHFLKTRSSQEQKKMHREEISVSFKYFPIWAELEDFTCCFWRNPLGSEDVRV